MCVCVCVCVFTVSGFSGFGVYVFGVLGDEGFGLDFFILGLRVYLLRAWEGGRVRVLRVRFSFRVYVFRVP